MVKKIHFSNMKSIFISCAGSDNAPPRRYSPLDIVALEDVALHHTKTETSYDMGTVNF